MDRELDGIYFRTKREDTYKNVCFSDLTKDEQAEICSSHSKEFVTNLAMILADKLREIGDVFDIVGGIYD